VIEKPTNAKDALEFFNDCVRKNHPITHYEILPGWDYTIAAEVIGRCNCEENEITYEIPQELAQKVFELAKEFKEKNKTIELAK